MAVSLETLLKIKAQVTGGEAIQGLAQKIGGLQSAGSKAGQGLKGLANSAGGLVGGLQMLVPLASGAGLVALGKGAIDAADNMRDMSQKTGISVERLSQLKQAAEMSGTTLESVSKGLVKLNRGLIDGKADAALKQLGITSKDASGKLKSADTVLIEIANKFATMPDGAAKTGLAIQLFGKSGADMVPLLNMGGDAISKLSVTMTTKFANAADEANDKMVLLQAKFGQIGVTLGTALLPFLIATTDALSAIVGGFSALPEPIQGVILSLGLLVIAWGPIVGFIATITQIGAALAGLQLGATIAGWAGAITPAIAAISAAFTGFIAFLTGTVLPALVAFFSGPVGWTVLAVAAVVAMVVLFREPIGKFLVWLGEQFSKVLPALITLANNIFVQPFANLWNNVIKQPVTQFLSWLSTQWNNAISTLAGYFANIKNNFIAIWDAVKGPVTAFFNWFKGFVDWTFKAAYAIIYQIFVQPWINLWDNVLRGPVTAAFKWIQSVFNALGTAFNTYVAKPISELWSNVVKFLQSALTNTVKAISGIWSSIASAFNTYVAKPISELWSNVVKFLQSALANVAKAISGIWSSIASAFNAYVAQPLRNTWQSVVSFLLTAVQNVSKSIATIWTNTKNAFIAYLVTPIKTAWTGMITFLSNAMTSLKNGIVSVWNSIIGTIKNVLNNVLRTIAGGINGLINSINYLINGFNRLPGPDIPRLGYVPIPRFAQGGYITGPTLGIVGEGGQPEYIIPESRMAAASARYMAGARGAALLAPGGAPSGAGAPVINITTGPVVEFDGQRYVTVADFEKGLQQAANRVFRDLRTPAGRYAMGIR